MDTPAPTAEPCRCEHPKSAHYDHDDEGGTSCRRQFCECAAYIPAAPPKRVSEGKEEGLRVHETEEGEFVCQHGTAMDVHCCNCHSGFVFDYRHECPAASPERVSEGKANRFDCETCGKGIAVDEDGCCRTCGVDAIVIATARPAVEPREERIIDQNSKALDP